MDDNVESKKEAKEAKEDKGNKVSGGSVGSVIDTFDAYEIIRAPLSTEKSIRKIEFDNTLVFSVHPRATKKDVKRAIEEMFKVTVANVNIQNSFTGQKRAYVRLGGESLASDVSADLGLI